MADLFDLVRMTSLVTRTRVAPSYWLDQFFQSQINFETEWIMFDKVYNDDRRLAPFVVPNVAGRPQSLDGFDTYRFKPAYSKIKDVVDYTMHMDRVPGEALGGTLTIEQRRNAVKIELIRRQKIKHRNTQNWLAARAIIDGKVIIESDDYPRTLVDFRRDPSLTVTLTGAAKWDQSTANPLQDLRDSRINANELSGARIRRWTFGANAWDLFCQRVDLREMMNKNYDGTKVRMTLIDEGYPDSVEYMGQISGIDGQGAIDIYVDTTRFVDKDGNTQFHLDQNKVVGVSDMVQGVRCFGAIMDSKAGFQPLEIFMKNWEIEDPSHEYIMSQSAPLMVPKEPNATVSITVA